MKEVKVNDILNGSTVAIGRALSLAEIGGEKSEKLIDGIQPHAGNAYVVGITGSPGSGKSTTIDKLVKQYRKDNLTVGVLAIDPTSPFTGGSILGDRIRMGDHTLDDGVFIRSMASRGYLGGISAGTYDSITVLDAAGFDRIIVETVGVGQSEVDVVKVADASVLIMTPEYGDDIQMIKSGIMEIADVFAINKTYLPNCPKLEASLQEALMMTTKDPMPAVVKANATDEDQVIDLKNSIESHIKYLVDNDLLESQRKDRIEKHLLESVYHEIQNKLHKRSLTDKRLAEHVEDIASGKQSVYGAVKKIVKRNVFW